MFKKAQNPDMVYYDIVSTNFQSTTSEEPFLRFNETRTNPVIQNSGEYYLSIVRFSLDTYNLPNFICEIQPEQANPILSIYSVTLEFDDGVGNITPSQQRYINWIPQNKNLPVPIPPNQTVSGFQETNTEYYYCYQFQFFIELINLALGQATADIIATVPTLLQPVLTWDVTTSKAILQAQASNYNQSNVARVKIYFNPPLFALFNSFPSFNFGTGSSVTLGRNYQMLIADYQGVNTILLPTNPIAPVVAQVWTQMFQEFSTIDTWTPISSIVFTSNTVPIISNQLSAPLIFNNGKTSVGIGNNANFAQIITDFQTNQQVFKPNILYTPTAEYRRIDMTGNQPLTNIDINVYWRDKLGSLVPFRLASGSTASIKFLFEKKNRGKPEYEILSS